MQRYHVGARQQCFQRFHALGAGRTGRGGIIDARITRRMIDDLHVERSRRLTRHGATDATIAHNAQRLAAQRAPQHERGTQSAPRAAAYVTLPFTKPTHRHQHQRNRNVGRIVGHDIGRVADREAGPLGRRHVDVIHAHPHVTQETRADARRVEDLFAPPVGYRGHHDVRLLQHLLQLLRCQRQIRLVEQRVVARRNLRLNGGRHLSRDHHADVLRIRGPRAHADTRHCCSAAPTPLPSVISMPASHSAISTPDNAPANVRLFVSPM